MLTALIVTAILLPLAAVGIALSDRALAALAEHKASEYLSEPFGHAATVRVHGAPFLTQAVRGRYRDVEVAGGGIQIGDMTGATLHARLRNIYLPLRELLSGRTTELPCEHVEGRLVLPYGEIARVSPMPGLALNFRRGRLEASAAVPVPGISQLARVSGDAEVTVSSGAVWLHITGVTVAGLSLTSLVIKQLLPKLSFPVPLPVLPWGLHLDKIVPVANGLVIYAAADAVVFKRSSDATHWDGDLTG